MLDLAFEYYGLVTLLAMATIQAASSFNGLKGIVFFQHPLFNYIVSTLVILPCLAALLTWNWRNPTGIVEGAQQFYFFMLGMVTSILATLFFSSFINHSRFRAKHLPPSNGLESLRDRTFFQAISLRFRGHK